MSSPDPIGGFFGLEPGGEERRGFPHWDALLLSSGRACFEYVLRAVGAARVYLPAYICDAMIEPLDRLGTPRSFYAIDENLEPRSLPALGPGEYLVYVNYFGLKDEYCGRLAAEYGPQLILDCSQALFFAPPPGTHSFYSPRKFVGIPDGGCLHSDLTLDGAALEADSSHQRYAHLIGRIDLGPEAAYPLFQAAEESLSGRSARLMSPSTRRLLAETDFDRVQRVRSENFVLLHNLLKNGNRLALPDGPAACPMVYPYLNENPALRGRLIDAKVFVATYWPNVLQGCGETEWEYRLADRVLPLPIDQRYGGAEMERIAALVQ
jgi:hypothetical protein